MEKSIFMIYLLSRKFCIRGHNNKVDSIETGCIVIAHLLPLKGFRKVHVQHIFLINNSENLLLFIVITLFNDV